MDLKNRIVLFLLVFFSLAVFVWLVSSSFALFIKLGLIVLLLVFTGFGVKRLTGQEGYYGLVIIRMHKGFSAMKAIAERFPRACRELTDFGLTLFFGVLYGFLLFRRDKRKFLIHFVLLVSFLAFFQVSVWNFASISFGQMIVFVLSVFFGLFAIGMLSLVYQAYNILTIPTAEPGVGPAIPGLVSWMPLVEGIIAIIVIAVVHELAHGVLCMIERLKLKSSGVLLFGFLPIGAFVEPDEKALSRAKPEVKRRILIAGSTSNIIFFLVFLFLSALVSFLIPFSTNGVVVSNVSPHLLASGGLVVGDKILEVDGIPVKTTFDLDSVFSGKGAEHLVLTQSGLKKSFFTQVSGQRIPSSSTAYGIIEPGEVILEVDGKRVYSISQLQEVLSGKKEGDVVFLKTEKGEKSVVLGKNGKMGATFSQSPAVFVKNDSIYFLFLNITDFVLFLLTTFRLIFFLSLTIAVVNVLPLFITDGHRLIAEELMLRFGKKNAKMVSRIVVGIGLLTLALIVINALPYFR